MKVGLEEGGEVQSPFSYYWEMLLYLMKIWQHNLEEVSLQIGGGMTRSSYSTSTKNNNEHI
jgi:hypothetical protein